MNLETVPDFGKTPFIYVFVAKYFLNSLSCPIMLNNFYSSTPFRSYITHWFVVGCLFPLLENWVEIAVVKRVNIGDQVLSFRYNLVFSTIHPINDYPVDNAIYFPDTSLRVN